MGNPPPGCSSKSSCHVGVLAETFASSSCPYAQNRFTDVDITEDCTIAAAAAAVTAAVGDAAREVKAATSLLATEHDCTKNDSCVTCTQNSLQHALLQRKAARIFGLLETVYLEGTAHFDRIAQASLEEDMQTRVHAMLTEFDTIANRADAIHEELATILREHDAKIRAMRLAADAARTTKEILQRNTELQ